MVIEGKGEVPPIPVAVPIDKSECELIRTEAIRRSEYRCYQGRSDVWGRGLIRGEAVEIFGKEMPLSALPIAIGMVGEQAITRYTCRGLKLPERGIDLLLKPTGDRGTDLELYALKIQVKCRKRDYGAHYIRCKNDRGRDVPLGGHLHVFCQWEFTPTVMLIGWEWNRKISRWTKDKSPVGKHWNYVGKDEDLLPMTRLLTELRARKDSL